MSYDVVARTLDQDVASGRNIAYDASTAGAQGRNSAYAGSGFDRGHLAQREAFKGSEATERAADLHTHVVPMTPELNRRPGSLWRLAEATTIELARKYGWIHVGDIADVAFLGAELLDVGGPQSNRMPLTIERLNTPHHRHDHMRAIRQLRAIGQRGAVVGEDAGQ